MGRTALTSFLLLAVLGASAWAQDEAAPAASPTAGLSGNLRYNAFVQFGDPDRVPFLEKNGMAGTLTLERTFGSHTRVFAEARTTFEGAQFTLSPGEVYVQESFGPFDVDLGRRLVFWGRFDGLSPFDVVNPHDYTILSSDPMVESRLPVLLGRVAGHFGGWDFDALVVPQFAASVTPFQVSSLAALIPTSANLTVTTSDPSKPDLKPANFDYGLKASTNWEGWDLYGVGFWGTNDNALTGLRTTVTPQPMGAPKVNLAFSQSYYQYGVLGAGFEKTFGAFDLKGEAAYDFNPDTADGDLYSPNPDVKFTGGLSWSATSELSFDCQYSQTVLVGFDQAKNDAAISAAKSKMGSSGSHLNDLLADKGSQTLAPMVRWSWNDQLTVQAGAQIDLPDLDWFANPMVTWNWSDNLHLTAGATIFTGASNTTWGRMDKADAAFFIATAYF